MKAVIKIGGTLLEDAGERLRLARQIAGVWRTGHQILIVHGGGKQLTGFLEKTGVTSHFVDGLRVTTTEALDGVVKVFAGTVNHQLLATFVQVGIPAAGISGIDASCLTAERLVGQNRQDWGFVGKIKKADPHLWEVLLAGSILPIMACLAVGEDGQIYNVNADQAAAACAAHFHAERLVFLTDVDGVRDAGGNVLSQLTCAAVPELLASGAVTGGMLAKLEAVREASANRVGSIYICNGRREGVLEDIFSGRGENAGTVVLSVTGAAPKGAGHNRTESCVS